MNIGLWRAKFQSEALRWTGVCGHFTFLRKSEPGTMRPEGVIPRVIFIGDSGVGKTSLIQRATLGVFGPPPLPTVGAGVRPITVTVRDATYKFHLWDTAGQEVYRSIVPLYFKQAACAILVFSLTDANSFRNLREWLDLLYFHTDHTIPAVIVGNKLDCPHRPVEEDSVRQWAESQRFPLFFTSASSGTGIRELLEHITGYIPSAPTSFELPAKANDDRRPACC
jgi:Ras-related protein Rab-5C